MRKLTLACAVVAASVLALPCRAADLSKTPQVTVQFSDLNLSRTEGAKALIGRLNMAAQTVCGYRSIDVRDLRGASSYRDCYRNAMDSAVHDVDNRFVAEVYGNPMLVADHGSTVAASASDIQTHGVVLSSR